MQDPPSGPTGTAVQMGRTSIAQAPDTSLKLGAPKRTKAAAKSFRRSPSVALRASAFQMAAPPIAEGAGGQEDDEDDGKQRMKTLGMIPRSKSRAHTSGVAGYRSSVARASLASGQSVTLRNPKPPSGSRRGDQKHGWYLYLFKQRT